MQDGSNEQNCRDRLRGVGDWDCTGIVGEPALARVPRGHWGFRNRAICLRWQSCTVSEALRDGRIVHRFSVEPRITSIDPKGPSANILRENDVLVAIDGSLVTTLEGGYKLANAKIGKAVRLRIRRGANELEVPVVPGKGCNLPGLTVTQ